MNSFKFLVKEGSVKIVGFVIMPNHIHLIWKSLKDYNLQLSFMKFTGQQLKFLLIDNNDPLLNDLKVEKADREYQIWQRNPLAIELYTPKILEQKLDYIHNNPCQGKWLLADNPTLYKYSSSSFYENEDQTFPFLTHYKDLV